MLLYALKMLVGDRAKFIGIVLGLTFASFIITQQAGIFVGLMKRTYGFVTDTSQPNIWVMDRRVQYIDDIKPLKSTELARVQGIEGVEWAVPLFKGLLKARLYEGRYQLCNVIGLDDATLIGGPPEMIEGNLRNLRFPDAVIVNEEGVKENLANPGPPRTPLRVGEVFEINDHRALTVGICKVTPTFQSQPVIYTTITRAITFAPSERNLLSFILVKSKEGLDPKEVCDHIERVTGLAAYTSKEFKTLTVDYFLKNTGIPVNFGVAVLLGFLIGIAIAGQTFYNFAHDNLRFFATYKAMGASGGLITKMILFQAVVVGGIGWGLGIGLTSLFGFFSAGTELSFALPWQLLLASFLSIFLIVMTAAGLAIQTILKQEPAIVFQT